MSDLAKKIIQEWEKRMSEISKKYQQTNPEICSNGGFYYGVDEEDGFLEWFDQEIGIENAEEKEIRDLKYWSNERVCFPSEWVEQMIDEGIRLSKKK